MDPETSKNLITRIRKSDLDEAEQEEAIALVQEERKRSRPEATIMVRGPEDDDMGGAARLTLGEETTVETGGIAVDLELTQLADEFKEGDGTGTHPSHGYDDEIIGADYHLTYGQAKYLLKLLNRAVDEEIRVGTPGDAESELRRLFGDPADLNRWIEEVQENGVRGWRTV